MKIKNINYRQFLDQGIIKTIKEEDLKQVLNNIKNRRKRELRALIITLYYTGARPNEILKMMGKDVQRELRNLKISLVGSKGGLPRTVYLRMKFELVKELWDYFSKIPPQMYAFYHYIGKYERKTITKKGNLRIRYETTDKLRYHVKRAFSNLFIDGITPYYLRHNRFSKLAEAGASIEEMRQLKGSRTGDSIMPYLHMSTEKAKSISKKID